MGRRLLWRRFIDGLVPGRLTQLPVDGIVFMDVYLTKSKELLLRAIPTHPTRILRSDRPNGGSMASSGILEEEEGAGPRIRRALLILSLV